MPPRPILLCYGTRPQVIKASRLLPALRQVGTVVAVDSGQHYDFALHGLLYQQLGVTRPDRFLEVGSGPLVEQTAAIMTRVAAVLTEVVPRLVVVIGDTITTLGAGLAAAQRRIPLVHVEAGLRADDLQMAEEITRRAVDHVAQLLCAPSDAAADRLRSERVGGTIINTGDVARDVLHHALPAGRASLGTRPWPLDLSQPFVLTTLHRAELVDHRDRLAAALSALAKVACPVLLPLHPRTKASIDRFGLGGLVSGAIHPIDPVGYLEAIGLVDRAGLVITDSGGVQREAYWLGTPCLTLRHETEWTETVSLGANRLVPVEMAGSLASLAAERLATRSRAWNRDAYGRGDAAARIKDAVSQV